MKLNKLQSKAMLKCKLSLMLDQPFVATLLMGMPMEYTDAIPTAATNGVKMLINPEFFFGELADDAKREGVRPQDYQKFVLAHEVMHKMWEHIPRCKINNFHMKKFNVAGDYAINLLLQDMGFKVPRMALLDKQYANMSAEQIYHALPKDDDYEGDIPVTGSDMQEAEGGEKEARANIREVQAQVAQAAQAAQAQGHGLDSLPAGLRNLIDDILYPKKSWREILHEFVNLRIPNGYNWKQPNRRYVSDGLFLPKRKTMAAIDNMLIAVDTSGSVDEQLLAEFVTEINGIRSEVAIDNTHIVYCDTHLYEGGEFDRYEEITVKPKGGGGTSFKPVFELANREQPDLMIYFTDLMGTFPDDEPAYPVLWAEYGGYVAEQDVPFGRVIHVDQD